MRLDLEKNYKKALSRGALSRKRRRNSVTLMIYSHLPGCRLCERRESGGKAFYLANSIGGKESVMHLRLRDAAQLCSLGDRRLIILSSFMTAS